MKLQKTDKQLHKILKQEEKRQKTTLQMIPSENATSEAVREAVGSVFCNKYAEGYPKRRYYQGNANSDEIELLAIERAKTLFGVEHVNVQLYSGAPANMAVYYALLDQGECIMGMALNFGGHLSHGHPQVTYSGRNYASIQYTTDKKGFINYKEIEDLAKKYQPKLIISGSTAYPRIIDFKRIGQIADKVGAYHVADISHIAGLVASGEHPSPVRYADVITTTTHKTLRGPRGAMIMVTKKGLRKDPELAEKIDKAVFPGLQGGPHMNTIAGIAVCLKEAQSAKFIKYTKQIIKNTKALAKALVKYKFDLITGGSDNHLLLVNLENKKIDGWCAAWALEAAGIIVNRNTVPYEKKSAYYPSGIRLGTPFITTMGLKQKDMLKVAKWINEVVDITAANLPENIYSEDKTLSREARIQFKKEIFENADLINIKKQVAAFCLKY
jgi:glycine hydroxymethyltransferase